MMGWKTGCKWSRPVFSCSCHLAAWHCCHMSSWLCLLVGFVRCFGMRGLTIGLKNGWRTMNPLSFIVWLPHHYSNLAPEMCIEEKKEGGDKGVYLCGKWQCYVLSPQDNDTWSLSHHLGFVVHGGGWEDSCGLFIVPKSNISKCWHLIWAWQGHSILNWCWFTLF